MSVPRFDIISSPFIKFNVNSIPDYNFLQAFEFFDISLRLTVYNRRKTNSIRSSVLVITKTK